MFKIFIVVMALVNGDPVMNPQVYGDALNTFATQEECDKHRESPEFKLRVDAVAEATNEAYRKLHPYATNDLDVRIGTSCRQPPGSAA
jgi:hypothetical protein